VAIKILNKKKIVSMDMEEKGTAGVRRPQNCQLLGPSCCLDTVYQEAAHIRS